jgi:DNA repair ATPase RecN
LRYDTCATAIDWTGRNGSGKSTVLLAISLCLGGKIPAAKAKEKGAGAVVSPVIRGGTDIAEVEIELLNEGDASVTLPQAKYGKRIILKRVMSSSAAGRTNSTFIVINGSTGAEISRGASANLSELEVSKRAEEQEAESDPRERPLPGKATLRDPPHPAAR